MKMECIPRNIFQTWVVKNLPNYMKINVDLLKLKNREFTHHLYDDDDCSKFIEKNFSEQIFWAYKSIVPGAYKADLWRYCVLYIYGGIYIDIKLKCVNGFKLINLLQKEHFCIDRPGYWKDKKSFGIYNAIIVSKAKNPLLLNCIYKIVEHVRYNYYGPNALYPTGPGLMGDLFLNGFYKDKDNITMKNLNNFDIIYEDKVIFRHYKEYRTEQNNTENYKSYGLLWKQKKIYNYTKISKDTNIKFYLKNESKILINPKNEIFLYENESNSDNSNNSSNLGDLDNSLNSGDENNSLNSSNLDNSSNSENANNSSNLDESLNSENANNSSNLDESLNSGNAHNSSNLDNSLNSGDANDSSNLDNFLNPGDVDNSCNLDNFLNPGDVDNSSNLDNFLNPGDVDNSFNLDKTEKYSSEIPLIIWQTWKNKTFPKNMAENIYKLKYNNPEFLHYVLDDYECECFLKEYYSPDVLYAFKNIIPGAYKADLWRYCILYAFGGIYLDIKFECLNNFKLINLTQDEHYVLDLENKNFHKSENECIFNGIMINKPKNILLIYAINQIIENVKNKYYGENWLEPTGPNLLGKLYNKIFKINYKFHEENSEEIIKKSKIDIHFDKTPPVKFIFIYKKFPIIGQYKNYRKDLVDINYVSYAKHWENKTVYLNQKIEIPKIIWQTWSTKILPKFMQENVNKLIEENKDFEYHFFDDNDCYEFIKNNFDLEVSEVFLNLIPGAYKADLWRYCVLYIHGGIYMDIKYRTINKFNLNSILDSEHYIMDRLDHFEKGTIGIHQSFLVCAKNNPLMLRCIKQIIENYKNNFYGYSALHPTGPGLIGSLYLLSYTDFSKIDMKNIDSSYVEYKNKFILTYYKEYRSEQQKNNYVTYEEHWKNKNIYNKK